MDKYAMDEQYTALSLPVCEKNVVSELSGDFSLSDYQPEIKRLLRVSAGMLPPSKYFGAGNAEFAGNIDYYVLYMGADNEIYCAPLSGEYSVSVPIDRDEYVELGDELCTVAQIIPDMVSGRVTSPRHITIRCRLRTNAKFYGDGRVMSTVTRCNGTVEKLKSDVSNMSLLFGVSDTIPLTDEIIPDARDGEFRVVCADGRVLVNEVSAGKDEIICRGELNLKMIMSREDGSVPSVSTRRIPFSSIIPCEGITPDSTVYAKGSLCELTLTVDEGRILVEAGIILEAVGQKNRQVSYISDMYSTENSCECEYVNVSVPEGIAGFNRNLTFSESMTLAEAKIGESAAVMDACGVAYIDEYKFEGSKCKISGRCKFNLQLFENGDYTGCELEMPFKYEYDMPEQANGDVECEVEASIIFCRARVDGERVGIDAEISLCGRMWKNCKCRVLRSYTFSEELQKSRGEILVCYPKRNDTLWSVGKRYNASIVGLCASNKLPQNVKPDSIVLADCVDYLII